MKTLESLIIGIGAILLISIGYVLFILYLIEIHTAPRQLLIISPFMIISGSILGSYWVNRGAKT